MKSSSSSFSASANPSVKFTPLFDQELEDFYPKASQDNDGSPQALVGIHPPSSSSLSQGGRDQNEPSQASSSSSSSSLTRRGVAGEEKEIGDEEANGSHRQHLPFSSRSSPQAPSPIRRRVLVFVIVCIFGGIFVYVFVIFHLLRNFHFFRDSTASSSSSPGVLSPLPEYSLFHSNDEDFEEDDPVHGAASSFSFSLSSLFSSSLPSLFSYSLDLARRQKGETPYSYITPSTIPSLLEVVQISCSLSASFEGGGALSLISSPRISYLLRSMDRAFSPRAKRPVAHSRRLGEENEARQEKEAKKSNKMKEDSWRNEEEGQGRWMKDGEDLDRSEQEGEEERKRRSESRERSESNEEEEEEKKRERRRKDEKEENRWTNDGMKRRQLGIFRREKTRNRGERHQETTRENMSTGERDEKEQEKETPEGKIDVSSLSSSKATKQEKAEVTMTSLLCTPILPISPPSSSSSSSSSWSRSWPYKHPAYFQEDLEREEEEEEERNGGGLRPKSSFRDVFQGEEGEENKAGTGRSSLSNKQRGRGGILGVYIHRKRRERMNWLEMTKPPWLLERIEAYPPRRFLSLHISDWSKDSQAVHLLRYSSAKQGQKTFRRSTRRIEGAREDEQAKEEEEKRVDPHKDGGAKETEQSKDEEKKKKRRSSFGETEEDGVEREGNDRRDSQSFVALSFEDEKKSILKEHLCTTYDPLNGVRMTSLLSSVSTLVLPHERHRRHQGKPVKEIPHWRENSSLYPPCDERGQTSLYGGCHMLKISPFSFFPSSSQGEDLRGEEEEEKEKEEEEEFLELPSLSEEERERRRREGEGLLYHMYWGGPEPLNSRTLWAIDSLFASMPRVTLRFHVLLPSSQRELRALHLSQQTLLAREQQEKDARLDLSEDEQKKKKKIEEPYRESLDRGDGKSAKAGAGDMKQQANRDTRGEGEEEQGDKKLRNRENENEENRSFFSLFSKVHNVLGTVTNLFRGRGAAAQEDKEVEIVEEDQEQVKKKKKAIQGRLVHASQLQLFWRAGYDLQYIQHVDINEYIKGTPLERHIPSNKFDVNSLSDNSFFFGFFQHTKQSAISDLMRTLILYKEGGTYFDTDVISLQSSSHLAPHFFFCEHPSFDEVEERGEEDEEEEKKNKKKESGPRQRKDKKTHETVLRHCGINPCIMRSHPLPTRGGQTLSSSSSSSFSDSVSSVPMFSSASVSFLHDVLVYQSRLLDKLSIDELFKTRWGTAGPRAYHTVLTREWYQEQASSPSSSPPSRNNGARGKEEEEEKRSKMGDNEVKRRKREEESVGSKRSLLRFAVIAPLLTPGRFSSISKRRRGKEDQERLEETTDTRKKRGKEEEEEEDSNVSSSSSHNEKEKALEVEEDTRHETSFLLWVYGPSSFAPLQLTPADSYPSITDEDFWRSDKIKRGFVKLNEAIKENNVISWHTYDKATWRLEKKYLLPLQKERSLPKSSNAENEKTLHEESVMSVMRATYCSVYCGSEILSLLSEKETERFLVSYLPDGVLDRILGLSFWLQHSAIPFFSSWMKSSEKRRSLESILETD
ncbi:glycosyltransferase family protein [Cystoisospora suis]|uniref:Glycosyltransferase family protein n=1 Tax=Cystoisospora suis TaxID=483139 RepID=A0A2C6KJU7_9APIC|nr:glycosyltransferase family protein [Cystoisospora suis]